MSRYLPPRSMLVTILTALVFFGMGTMVGSCHRPGKNISVSRPVPPDEVLYWKIASGNDPHADPRALAHELASRYVSSPWVICMLATNDPFFRLYPTDEPTQALDCGIIAALLEGIPSDAPKGVLLAVTARLTDSRRGRYSTKEGGWLMTRISECITPPMNELALAVLKRNTGWDYGYDIERWREAILLNNIPATQPSHP